jgi:hypothetical protein
MTRRRGILRIGRMWRTSISGMRCETTWDVVVVTGRWSEWMLSCSIKIVIIVVIDKFV